MHLFFCVHSSLCVLSWHVLFQWISRTKSNNEYICQWLSLQIIALSWVTTSASNQTAWEPDKNSISCPGFSLLLCFSCLITTEIGFERDIRSVISWHKHMKSSFKRKWIKTKANIVHKINITHYFMKSWEDKEQCPLKSSTHRHVVDTKDTT